MRSHLVAVLALGLGCGGPGAGLDAALDVDAARPEVPRDAAAPDAGALDAARPDAGGLDAGALDAGDPRAGELLRVEHEVAAIGPYARADLDAEWGDVEWASIERAEIVAADASSEGRFLRVHYPEGGVGPDEGGAQFRVRLPASHDRLFVAYRVRFAPGFDFVRGGKLPGLFGGAGNTGGSRPTGSDGWSGRMMWRELGRAVQYVYHPDQPTVYGEDFDWDLGGERRFDDAWHVVEHEIVMNTPGAHDGAVRAWLDGEPALERSGLRFRDVDTFAIDGFYFSTFFGGSDASWAATRDEHVDFDTFVIGTAPISH